MHTVERLINSARGMEDILLQTTCEGAYCMAARLLS